MLSTAASSCAAEKNGIEGGHHESVEELAGGRRDPYESTVP
jgi:hypothetical protein